jgi:TRAP-type C4-dicarboxylate transport system substrate-binding protein
MPARLRILATLLPLAVLLGCGGADKVTGARAGAVTTLTLANANLDPGSLQRWIDDVGNLSNGRLRIRVSNNWRYGEREVEKGLIADVRAGRAQLGWVASRAWTAVGVHSLDPLNVPFEVHSYAGEQAELTAGNRAALLAGVSSAGVEPVGLVPGPMHLVLVRRPVRHAADLRGLRIGVFASDVGERALRALGVVAVPLARDASPRGLDGVAEGLGDLAARYVAHAPYLLADAPLGPAPRVIFANRQAWSRLSADQRTILRRAAELAFAPMLRAWEADDRNARAKLCDGGVHVVDIGAQGRAALQRGVGPVYDQVSRLAGARAAAQAVERGRAADEAPMSLPCARPPAQTSALTGVFAYTVRRGASGSAGFDFGRARWIRFQVVLRNGRAVQTAHWSDGRSEIGFDEKYRVYRDRIELGGNYELTARWQLDGNRLRFTEMNGGPDDRRVWASHTWIRVRR